MDHAVCGESHCENQHYFDFSLSGRPKGAWGRARQLLTASDDSIKVVAAKLGFSSSAVFATAFRRSCGVSPSQFRTHRLGCAAA
jgi:hypothetical protein